MSSVLRFTDQSIFADRVGKLIEVVPTSKGILRREYKDEGAWPIVDQGRDLVAGFTDQSFLVIETNGCIVFGDHTRAVKWVDFDFVVGADGVKVLQPIQNLNAKFAYYALSNLKIPNLGYNRHWKVLSDLQIPVPPLEVQEEIVRVLDHFTMLEAELEAELEARRLQYAYYQNILLSSEANKSWNWVGLAEIATIRNGKDHKHLAEGVIPVYGSGGIMRFVDSAASQGPTVLIPRKGSLSNLFYVEGPFWNVDTIFSTKIDHDQIVPKFLFYWLRHIDLEKLNTAGGVPSLTQRVLNRVRVPLPPMEEQLRIVSVLDKFDALVSDLSSGLPAEIAARRKQYEFYRDRLLSFDELKV